MDYEVFDKWAETYDRSISGDWIHDRYDQVLGFMGDTVKEIVDNKRIRLLDIGAGTGNLISKLQDINIEINTIEPSIGMREKLLQKCPNVNIIDGELPELPIFEEKFDCIVSSYVIHHVDHQKSGLMIDRICKNLKPDGLALLADVMFESKKLFDDHISDLRREGLTERIEEILDEPFQFVDVLCNCFSRNGMNVDFRRFSYYTFCLVAR